MANPEHLQILIQGVEVWTKWREKHPEIRPDLRGGSLWVAQFVYMLLKHQKLRDVVSTLVNKGVLLLGRFSNGGLELLQMTAAKLREKQYVPMIFDFDRPDNRNYTETIKALVGLSKFVIVDLSGPFPIIEEGEKNVFHVQRPARISLGVEAHRRI